MPCQLLRCIWPCCQIPQRTVLVIFMHLAMQTSFNLRQVLSLAIVEMIEPKTDNTTVNECPMYEDMVMKDIEGGKYDWPSYAEAMILYAFYVGYVFSHVPGGWLADIYGGRHVLGTTLLISAFITAAFPTVVMKFGFLTAVLLRLILGFVQGPMMPCISSLMSTWIPVEERPIMGSIAYSGSTIGIVIGTTLSGLIIKYTNSWPYAFYFWSIVSVIWYLFYMCFVYSTPYSHPRISSEEKRYLSKQIEPKIDHEVPWGRILTNKPFLANLAGHVGHNFAHLTTVICLPKFMKDILQMDIQANSFLSSLPFFFMWLFCFVWGCLGNLLINRKWLSIVTMRKYFAVLSNVLSPMFLVMAVYVGCDRTAVVVLYILAMIAKAMYYSSLTVNINDLSQRFGGIMFAFTNASGSLAGVIGPYLVGHFAGDKSLAGWRTVFWIIFAIAIVTSAIFMIWGKAERQDFDMIVCEDEKNKSIEVNMKLLQSQQK